MTMSTGDLHTPGPVSPPKGAKGGKGAPKGGKGGQLVTVPRGGKSR